MLLQVPDFFIVDWPTEVKTRKRLKKPTQLSCVTKKCRYTAADQGAAFSLRFFPTCTQKHTELDGDGVNGTERGRDDEFHREEKRACLPGLGWLPLGYLTVNVL